MELLDLILLLLFTIIISIIIIRNENKMIGVP